MGVGRIEIVLRVVQRVIVDINESSQIIVAGGGEFLAGETVTTVGKGCAGYEQADLVGAGLFIDMKRILLCRNLTVTEFP